MTNVLANMARMTVTGTPGTGTITLNAAVSGFQTFANAGISDGDTVRYGITDGSNWEIGTGTYTASGTTLSRGATESSNSDAAISATSAAEVYVTLVGADIYVEREYTITGTTPSISAANGQAQKWTLTANSTPTDGLNNGDYVTLYIDDGTAYTVDFATNLSVTWKNTGGTAPTLPTSGYGVITLHKFDGNIYAYWCGDG